MESPGSWQLYSSKGLVGTGGGSCSAFHSRRKFRVTEMTQTGDTLAPLSPTSSTPLTSIELTLNSRSLSELRVRPIEFMQPLITTTEHAVYQEAENWIEALVFNTAQNWVILAQLSRNNPRMRL